MTQRITLIVLVLALVGLGLTWYRLRSTSPPAPLTPQQRVEAIQQGEVEYTNFLFDYSVILPDAWPIEDISQPLVVFLSPDETLTSGSEQTLYEGGAASIQIVGPKVGSSDAFYAFVRDSLEPGLKDRGVEFSGKKERIEGYDGYRVSITKPYKLTQLIFNGPLMARVSFQKSPKELKRLLTTFDQVLVPSAAGQEAMQLTDQFIRDGKAGHSEGLYAQTTAAFRAQLSEEQFQDQLLAGKKRFGLKPIIVSMLATNDTITTRSVLVDPEGTMNRVTLIFKQEGGAYRINGISISPEQDNAFKEFDLTGE